MARRPRPATFVRTRRSRSCGRRPPRCTCTVRSPSSDDVDEKRRIWGSGLLPYDPSQFFGTPENPDLVLLKVQPVSAVAMVMVDGALLDIAGRLDRAR